MKTCNTKSVVCVFTLLIAYTTESRSLGFGFNHVIDIMEYRGFSNHESAMLKKKAYESVDSHNLNISDVYYHSASGHLTYTIHTKGDHVFIAGIFTFIGNTRMNKLAYFNGSVWQPMGSTFSGIVNYIVRFNRNLYAVGYLTQTGSGSTMNKIARWTGSRIYSHH